MILLECPTPAKYLNKTKADDIVTFDAKKETCK